MRKTLYLLVVLMLLAACKRDKPLPEPVIDSVEVQQDEFTLDYREQTLSLQFTTNAEYSFEIGDKWITLADLSRTMESYSQSFLVAENPTADLRSTYIKIVAGDVEHIVTVEQGAKPEIFSLTLRHSATSLNSPVWMGESVRGRVDWGDGVEEDYMEGATHDYNSEGEHSVRFEMEGVTGFDVERLGDIQHLEIAF